MIGNWLTRHPLRPRASAASSARHPPRVERPVQRFLRRPPHPDLPSRGALGNGVADDKAMYCYVPRMIEFYLGEHAILNNVLTYMLRDPKQRKPVTLVPGPEAVGC